MIKINLSPPTQKKARRFSPGFGSLNLGVVFGTLFAALVVGTGGWWWALSAEASRLTREIADNQAELDRLRQVIAEHQKFKRDKEDLERRVNAIETVARNQTRPVYLVDAFVDLVPSTLQLTRMEEKGQTLRFAGVAPSTTIVADFMANLKASGKFKEVDLIESRQDLTKSPRTITFEVSARFEI